VLIPVDSSGRNGYMEGRYDTRGYTH
jgi:hypothetical protein